jgi:hypothetical protein
MVGDSEVECDDRHIEKTIGTGIVARIRYAEYLMAIRHNVPIKGVLTGVPVRPVPGSLRAYGTIAQSSAALPPLFRLTEKKTTRTKVKKTETLYNAAICAIYDDSEVPNGRLSRVLDGLHAGVLGRVANGVLADVSM